VSVPYKLPRGTRAALDTLAAANGLTLYQVYWLTDENRAVVATATNAYAPVGGNPNIQSVASAATVTPTFLNDQVNITAQAVALTLANWTGTAVDGFGIAIRIADNGTARAITYGTNYRAATGVTLPATTTVGKTTYLACVWNAASAKIDVVAVVTI
jgi:hypothetical protein